jgi:hypothetical protein
MILATARLDQTKRSCLPYLINLLQGEKECHPEPPAKDLAAAFFCGRDLPVSRGCAHSVVWTSSAQPSRRAGKAPSEILRYAQDHVPYAGRDYLRFGAEIRRADRIVFPPQFALENLSPR